MFLDNIVALIYILDLVFVVAMFALERGQPTRAMFWMTILLIFPIGGFVLYIIF